MSPSRRNCSATAVTLIAFISLFRGSAYACLITFYSSRSWCSGVLQFVAFLRYICVCHTSYDTLYISGCSDWCLCHSQWHNRNINVLCMVEFQLQDWPHCWYVNIRKVRVTFRLMHLNCLLMHAFPCSVNVRFYNILMAFKLFYCLFSGGGLFHCTSVMGCRSCM